MAQQKALFLSTSKGDFVVGKKDIPKPKAGEILVKVQATALNPMEWKIQRDGPSFIPSYPALLGVDSAGIVEDIGKGVTRFGKGDRVVHEGFFTHDNAAFQQYTLVPAEIAAKIPANIAFDEAASVPLGMFTAAIALYGSPSNDNAGLTPPWDGGLDAYKGQPIVVFGGSSSVGQYVIQFAKLSGFSPIITTASLHNADHLKTLGATHVIDRKADVPADVCKITTEPLPLVYDAISTAETQAVAWDLTADNGSLILVSPVDPCIEKEKYPNKKTSSVIGNVHLPPNRALGVAVFGVLEDWLEKGLIKPNRVEVLPDGLAGIIGGLQRMEKDLVSGVKLVAHPQETA